MISARDSYAVLGWFAICAIAAAAAFVPSPNLWLPSPHAPVANPAPASVLTFTPWPPFSVPGSVVSRPVFNAGRRPDPAPVVMAAAPQVQPIVDISSFRLRGVIVGPDVSVAFISKENGPVSILKTGDTVEGWMVKEIQRNGAVMEASGRTSLLQLPSAPNKAGGHPQVNAPLASP